MPTTDDPSTIERFYYADGERVPLRKSTHFVALRTEHGHDATESAAVLATASTRDTQQPTAVLELAEYDLVVLDLPSGAAERGGALDADVAASAGVLGDGPAVYESAEGDGPSEGLIDVGEVIVRFEEDTSDADAEKLLRKHHLEIVQRDHPEPGAMLTRTTRRNDAAIDIANTLNETDGVGYASPNFVHLNSRLADLDESEVSRHLADVDIDDLEREAMVRAAEAMASPTVTPNDPGLSAQWGLHKIGAPQAWDISMGTPAISIAIVDDGGSSHEDYALAPGWDALENDANPAPLPADGHGTACAGVAAAIAGNSRGGAGVAPRCRVRHIRIARGIGGGFWYTTDAIVSAGIRKAVDLGADVLSNSYRVSPSSAVTSAFHYARSNGRGGKGAVLAAAAGNTDGGSVIYPARLSPNIAGMLAVGASNQWDQRKSKTSLDGENWWGSCVGPEVDVVAPGVKIYTTDIMGGGGYTGANYVPTFNGTSSATPHVAGLAGLILSVDPHLRSWEVEDIIKLTARELGPAGRDDEFGFGRIDARAALEAASKIWYRVYVFPRFLGSGKECYVRVYIRMFNPGINTVRLDGLTFRSHSTTGATLDQFRFRPDVGPMMRPRTGEDVWFDRVLLPANGNQSSWSYRWTMNWDYTYWRPTAPALPLGASVADLDADLDDAMAENATSSTVEGHDSGQSERADMTTASPQPGFEPATHPEASNGDLVSVDRQSRRITIVVT